MRRDKLEIILSILDACSESRINKTRIFYASNINFRLGSVYLNYLVTKGFLIEEDRSYMISEKGMNLLQAVKRIEEILSVNTEEQPFRDLTATSAV